MILPVAVVAVVALVSARSSFVRRCRLDAIVPSTEINSNAQIVSSEQRITFIGLDLNTLLSFQEGLNCVCWATVCTGYVVMLMEGGRRPDEILFLFERPPGQFCQRSGQKDFDEQNKHHVGISKYGQRAIHPTATFIGNGIVRNVMLIQS